MRLMCRALLLASLMSNLCLAEDPTGPIVPAALGDLVIQGLEQPVRLRLYATHDGVPWNDYATAARSEQLQALFRQLDSNGDGQLAPEEARRLPRPDVLGRTGRKPGVNVAFNYRALDIDGDGSASLAELQSYLDEYLQPGPSFGFVTATTERNPGDVFGALDADHDRRLTEQEWSNVAALLERDRDGNRVLTPDELRSPSSELFGPEFVAVPISQRGGANSAPLVVTLEPPVADEPDGVIRLLVRNSETGAPPTIAAELGDRAKSLGLTIDTEASPRLRLQVGRRYVELGCVQPGPHIKTALTAALLRKFDGLSETLGRPLTEKDDLPPELKATFSVADANGDGNLERTELEHCIEGYLKATVDALTAQLRVMFYPERRGLSTLIDQNHDGRLSLREMQGLPARLSLLCGDDRTIESQEAPSIATILFYQGPAAAAQDLTEFANSGPDWFVRADRNSDGDLDAEEFLGPPEIFAKIDANGDGWLELDEALRVNEAELVPAAETQP